MTHDEAVKIARTVRDADGGCPVCVKALAVDLAVDFPDHDWADLIAADPDRAYRSASFRAEIRRAIADRFEETK